MWCCSLFYHYKIYIVVFTLVPWFHLLFYHYRFYIVVFHTGNMVSIIVTYSGKGRDLVHYFITTRSVLCFTQVMWCRLLLYHYTFCIDVFYPGYVVSFIVLSLHVLHCCFYPGIVVSFIILSLYVLHCCFYTSKIVSTIVTYACKIRKPPEFSSIRPPE